MSFEKIFDFTILWEGGSKVTDDPNDSGEVTKWGIASKDNPDIDVVNLTESEAMDIYRERYWNPIAQGKDDNLDMAAFDSAVNCGVPTVKKWLLTCITWEDVTALRRQHCLNIVDAHPNDAKYLKG